MKRPLYNTIGRRSDYTSPTLDYFTTPVEQGFYLTDSANAGYGDNELEDLEDLE